MRKPFNLRPPRFNELMSTSDTDHELLEPLAATLEGWALHDDLNTALLEVVNQEREQAARAARDRLNSKSSPGRPKDWNSILNYGLCSIEFEMTTRLCNRPSGKKLIRRARAAGEITVKYEVSRKQLYARSKAWRDRIALGVWPTSKKKTKKK